MKDKEEVYLDKNFGSMPLEKKVEYLWMYYKIWLVMAAGLAFIAICGVYGSGAGASFIYEQF